MGCLRRWFRGLHEGDVGVVLVRVDVQPMGRFGFVGLCSVERVEAGEGRFLVEVVDAQLLVDVACGFGGGPGAWVVGSVSQSGLLVARRAEQILFEV